MDEYKINWKRGLSYTWIAKWYILRGLFAIVIASPLILVEMCIEGVRAIVDFVDDVWVFVIDRTGIARAIRRFVGNPPPVPSREGGA